jgi:TM2 domain-containing membrane protein YozV
MAKKYYLAAASSLAAADVNGDGIDEIIAAKNGTGLVVVLFADGTRTNIRAYWTYNTSVAAADLDGDGIAEILAGRATAINGGTSDLQMGSVRIFSADGVLKYSIEPFGQIHDGVTIAVGDLGL